jgi:hypothetical protein
MPINDKLENNFHISFLILLLYDNSKYLLSINFILATVINIVCIFIGKHLFLTPDISFHLPSKRAPMRVTSWIASTTTLTNGQEKKRDFDEFEMRNTAHDENQI